MDSIGPFVGTMFSLHKGFENPKSLFFWSYISFFIHFLDPLQVLFLIMYKSFTSFFSIHVQVHVFCIEGLSKVLFLILNRSFACLFSNPRQVVCNFFF
jgi:hypothetical protein